MKYNRPVEELVRARKSVRTFKIEAMHSTVLERLQEACRSQDKGIFGETARFTVVDKSFSKERSVKLMDYGMQKNPRYFIIGAITKGDRALESYGFLMEELVLKATELGLGSCWMGYFNRGFFEDFSSSPDELIPAIAVVGVPADSPRAGEKVIRALEGLDKRKDWGDLFFEGGFGKALERGAAGKYGDALEMVRLGPSSGNSQPWRVVRDAGSGAFHFFLKKTKEIYYRDGMHNLDVGIAMCHFNLAARLSGLAGEWRVVDPHLPNLPAGTEYRVSWHGK